MARTAARVMSDLRQPCASTSQPASGMKMVLAKPAISVITVIAWTLRRSNHLAAVAKAGSYSVVDMARPMAAQMTYSCGRLLTCDHASTSTLATTEPMDIASRGPCRSSHRPTGIAASPASSSASENAPVMSPRDHPISVCIGAR